MKIFYLIKTLLRLIYYLQSNEKRYFNLLINILRSRPKKILEIGVYNGRRAIQMIQAAKIFNNNIEYYGFDLFEDITNKIYKNEASKFPDTKKNILSKLEKHGKIFLYKGFTEKTLKDFSYTNTKVDFIFIDGGHNVQTIKNDYFYSSKIMNKNATIILDDYYISNDIDTNILGSNTLYEELNKTDNKPKLLPFSDKYIKNGNVRIIKMFEVKMKKNLFK